MTLPRHLRLAAASLFCFGAILGCGVDGSPHRAVGWLVVSAPFLAGGLLWVPRLEAQLLTRAILWAYLFWATLGALLIDDSGATRILLSCGLGTGGALLLLPAEDLERQALTNRFAPVAFRSVLVLILILAMTDALVLGINFLGHFEDRWSPSPWLIAFFGGGSLLMATAVVGLLRMRAWGFLLNLLTNVAVASLAWLIEEMPWQLALGLTTTAALQIVVALPLARRIAKPGAADPSGAYPRLGKLAVGAMLLALVGGRVVYELRCI